MRIVQLTPGAGGFYCGSCMRDNTLVRALRRLGHEATLLPIYLPMSLDEPSADPRSPILLGGINVYLQEKSAVFRRLPAWADRWLNAAPLLRAVARRAGMTRAQDLGPMTLSMLRGPDGRQAKELARLAEFLRSMGPLDVVILSNALLAGSARTLAQATGARVVCTLQGEAPFLDSLGPRHREEAWRCLAAAARHVHGFIAVSRWYAQVMVRRLGLPPERVRVIYNGIDLEGYPAPPPPRPPSPPAVPASPPADRSHTLGYLARWCPEKGLHTLIEAFILLASRRDDVRLCVVGTHTASDAPYIRRLRGRLDQAGVSHLCEFHPQVDRDRKIDLLRSMSVLSVPAAYGESFGLYALEALAAGVPVVLPDSGALPELIALTGGGLVCRANDPADLSASIETLLNDPAHRAERARTGQHNVHRHFSADHMARHVAEWLHHLEGEREASATGRSPDDR